MSVFDGFATERDPENKGCRFTVKHIIKSQHFKLASD